jgi:hypothetical protein
VNIPLLGKLLSWGQTSPLGANFTTGVKLMLLKTGLGFAREPEKAAIDAFFSSDR